MGEETTTLSDSKDAGEATREAWVPNLPWLALLALLFFLAVVRAGWVSDDGFITGRTLYEFFSGHGLVINAGHRVQAYTSPLWLLVSVPFYAILREPYLALLVPGLVFSAVFAGLLARGFFGSGMKVALVFLALLTSQRFLEFSTSGLENSLAHLLLLVLCANVLEPSRRRLEVIYGVAALLVLTRFDYGLLVLPLIVSETIESKKSEGSFSSVRKSAPFFLAPLVLWFGFSLLYYGFLFPNTAYAKLNTQIPFSEKWTQGVSYLVDSAYRDPALVVFAVAPFFVAPLRQSKAVQALLGGSLLYVLYVVSIGGDFMSGRFLTAPFLVGVLVLASILPRVVGFRAEWAALALGLFSIGTFADRRADRHRTECFVPPSGIVDERECYIEHTLFSQNLRVPKWKTHPYLAEYRKALAGAKNGVVGFELVGMATFAERSDAYILERFALSEPFLARLTFKPRGSWRPGHLLREVPALYRESLEANRNLLRDRCQHRLFDELELATRGPLFSAARFKAIWSLNVTHRTCPVK